MDAAEEEKAAAEFSAACRHEPNPHGICVFCGALKGDEGKGYEPPIRRPRHRSLHDALDQLAAIWCTESGSTPSSITLHDFLIWSARLHFGDGKVAQLFAGMLPRLLKSEAERYERSFSNQNFRAKRRRVERVMPLLFEYRDILATGGIASTGFAMAAIVDLLDGDVQRARENVEELKFANDGEGADQIRERFAVFVALSLFACDSAAAGDEKPEVQS